MCLSLGREEMEDELASFAVPVVVVPAAGHGAAAGAAAAGAAAASAAAAGSLCVRRGVGMRMSVVQTHRRKA